MLYERSDWRLLLEQPCLSLLFISRDEQGDSSQPHRYHFLHIALTFNAFTIFHSQGLGKVGSMGHKINGSDKILH